MNIIVHNEFENIKKYKSLIEALKRYNIFRKKDNNLYLLDENVSTKDLLSLNFNKVCNKVVEDNYIFKKRNYEKNTLICSNFTYSLLPTIDHIIYRINLITKKINTVTSKKYIIKLKKLRHIFMKNIIQYISNNKYFIFPYVLPYTYISKSFAIIGNSKNILENDNGKNIDLHKSIVRFNYAITKGSEKHCGSKSDIRVSIRACLTGDKYKGHPKGLIENYNIFRELPDKTYIVFTKDKSVNSKNILDDCKQNKINTTGKYYHTVYWDNNIFKDILSYFNISVKLDKFPQCGLGFLLILVDLGIIPDLYGFDINISSTNYGYYWNKKVSHTKLSKFHDIKKEHIIIKTLIRKKKIRYF